MTGSINEENLKIYFGSLSPFYLFSWAFTALAFLSTWWSRRVKRREPAKNNQTKVKTEWIENCRDKSQEKTHPPSAHATDQNLVRCFKKARQQAIEEQLTAGLSDDQLAKEREMQAQQLAAIFNLLKQQEDQFKINSMDELQEQMRLYRA